MLLPDVNVVLAGFRADHLYHRPARGFLEQARNRDEVLGLSDFALASVVRLATNPRVFVRPDRVESVLKYLDVLLEPPTPADLRR
jgi:predicted nucleic acid-binding protein